MGFSLMIDQHMYVYFLNKSFLNLNFEFEFEVYNII